MAVITILYQPLLRLVVVLCFSILCFKDNIRFIHGFYLLPHHPYYNFKISTTVSLLPSSLSSGSSSSLSLTRSCREHHRLVICYGSERSQNINNNNDNINPSDNNSVKEIDNNVIINEVLPSSMSSQQRKQEKEMESLSYHGTDKISKLSISERTKRAMLAEVLEDTIYKNIDKIDEYYNTNSGLLKNDNDRKIVDELTKETKTLQKQYQELVCGDSSTLLNSFEQLSSISTSTTANINDNNNNDSLL